MNTVTDIADLDADPLDEGVESARARLRVLGRASGVGLVLLDVLETLALKTAEVARDEVAIDKAGGLTAVAAARDLSLAYAKVSRSIRQSVLLEEKLETIQRDRASGLEDARRVRALKRAEAEAAKAVADEAAEFQRVHGPRLAREAAVSETMQQISFSREREDAEAMEALDREVAELLEEGAGYEAYGERPVSETVARLCKTLDLDPDWEEFAKEDWARDEARDGVAGSPYVSTERGGSGACVLAVRGLQGAGLAGVARETGPP